MHGSHPGCVGEVEMMKGGRGVRRTCQCVMSMLSLPLRMSWWPVWPILASNDWAKVSVTCGRFCGGSEVYDDRSVVRNGGGTEVFIVVCT